MTVSLNPKKLSLTLRPIMYLSHLMGVTFSAQIYKKKFRFVITYRIVILSLLMLCLLQEIPTITFWSRNLKGVHGMLAFIETRFRWFAVVANFLLTSYSNAGINNAIICLMNTQLILKKAEYNSIVRSQLFIILLSFLQITSFMVLGHEVLWTNIYYSWYTSTIYIVTEFYIGFSNIQFVIFLIVIRKYFGALNENLKKCDFRPNSSDKGEPFLFLITKGVKEDSVTEIVKFRQIHMNLTTTCWKVNQCFSLQVLLFLVVSMVEITYSLRAVTVYSIKAAHKDTSYWKSKPLWELALVCTWGGYYISSILLIIYACEAAVVESVKTSGVIHELLNKRGNKEVEKQIFSLQLMDHKVYFTAGRFVTLNFPLLNSIIGTITTYLVIIMTFTD